MNFKIILQNELKSLSVDREKDFIFFNKNSNLDQENKDKFFEQLFLIDIQKTFLFNSIQYDKNLFEELKVGFLNDIENNRKILKNYDNCPVEFILCFYFHFISNQIQKEKIFHFVDYLLKKRCPYSVLNSFVFVSDDELNNYIISFIEKKWYNVSSSFLFFKNEKLNDIKIKILFSYYNNNMLESFNNLLSKNKVLTYSSRIVELSYIFNSGNLKLNINKDVNKLTILLNIMSSDNYHKFFYQLFNILPKYFYDNSYISIRSTIDFKNTYTNVEPYIKNIIFNFYKMSFHKRIIKNKNMSKEDFFILLKIYCLCYDLFSKEETTLLLNHLNQESDYLKPHDMIVNDNSSLTTYFIFLCFKNNYNFNFSSIFNFSDVKRLTSFFTQFIVHNLLLFTEFEYSIFKNYFSKDFFINCLYTIFDNYISNAKEEEILFFTHLLNHLDKLDHELLIEFCTLHKDNIFIEKYYLNNQIESF